jgi:hypothetical protein
VERLLDHHPQLADLEGLGEIVGHAAAHRAVERLQRGVARHDHHGDGRVDLAGGLGEL